MTIAPFSDAMASAIRTRAEEPSHFGGKVRRTRRTSMPRAALLHEAQHLCRRIGLQHLPQVRCKLARVCP